ncbi:tRNA (adenosine(37)-N6)-threonylcarbamoyltransferase complex ATPase subunit type 1 TsaE [Jonquetella sp. BV3C21]|uniref:tRNA (adenosine(37)-N6)-threonylcarbamoyltransferase complex ATPase subunit type 1 TsaE n=1 Tax=Jonquetella sp. BV3C21 TaxID=1111126 RepID=UPI0003AD8E98|nr:tRNA (adenosine(37)-N6)-threonylcarbamoyltransferase complex ATPase subunit type 1 TsaE [Jonquetella sp. BV3C21]ERL23523.1 tRNA threonylcarbamoyl adenosine modification protein YjeE [Jonquetella sp. BV3C21]
MTGGESFSLFLATPDETVRLGEMLARCAFPGLAIFLEGDLGAGKTTLVTGMCRALGWDRPSSPTFAIVNEYPARQPLAHVDLYRLEDVDERDFGLSDYLSDGWILAIEWPDRLRTADFPEWWRIQLTCADSGRNVRLSSSGRLACEALKKLRAEVCRGD